MPRIRSVHPDICVSETVDSLPPDVEVTFVRLLTHCDDEGRCRDNLRLIKAAIFPLRDRVTVKVLDGWLSELDETGLIRRYEVGGEHYLEVTSWGEYQHPNKPTPSKFPDPLEPSRSPPGALPEPFRNGNVGLPPGVGGEKEKESPSEASPSEPSRSDVEGLCALLSALLIENGCREPTVTSEWRNQARLLLDKDGAEAAEAERVMRWALADPFWMSNILSMPKFRVQYDKLRLQSSNGSGKAKPERFDHFGHKLT